MIIMNKLIKVLTKDPIAITGFTVLVFISEIFLSVYLHKYLEKPLTNWLLIRNNLEIARNTE